MTRNRFDTCGWWSAFGAAIFCVAVSTYGPNAGLGCALAWFYGYYAACARYGR